MERRRLLITIFLLAASCASAFARDGSVRAVVDGQGSVVERNDYYTYGKRHTTGRTYADLKNSPLKRIETGVDMYKIVNLLKRN